MEMAESQKTQNEINKKKKAKKLKKKAKIKREHDNYYSFYDDLKHGDTSRVDW